MSEMMHGRVLLVEDEIHTQRLIADVLRRRGHAVLALTNGEEAWQAYQTELFPLVITDWMLPGLPGSELCTRIRSLERSRYTEILMITARRDPAEQQIALEAGADDYLTKPFSVGVLDLRLGVAERHLALRVAKTLCDESRRVALQDLHRLALEDPLTRVLRRQPLLERLRKEVSRARRYQRPLAFLALDFDALGRFNEVWGEAAGDALLRLGLSTCRNRLRESDEVGRLGSDKFGFILPETEAPDAGEVARRLIQVIAALRVRPETPAATLTASIGVSLYRPPLEKAEDMLRQADATLARARAQGGGTWALPDAPPTRTP